MRRWRIEKDYPYFDVRVKDCTDVMYQNKKRLAFSKGSIDWQRFLVILEMSND